jgi:hypothetical protein
MDRIEDLALIESRLCPNCSEDANRSDPDETCCKEEEIVGMGSSSRQIAMTFRKIIWCFDVRSC